MRALGRLKNLEYLDGIQVTDEEMTTALKMAAASRPSPFAILAHARTDQNKPRTLSLVPTAQAILASSQNKPVKFQDDDSQWFIKVTGKKGNFSETLSVVSLKCQSLAKKLTTSISEPPTFREILV